MNQIFLQLSHLSDPDEIATLTKVVDEAAAGQRSIIEDILNSHLVKEEIFLKDLSEELGLPWEAELKPRRKRQLRKVCSASLALKHRLLPLGYGTAAELDAAVDEYGELIEAPLGADVDGGEVGAVVEAAVPRLRLATYDPFNLVARQAASQRSRADRMVHGLAPPRIQGIRLYGVGADTFEQILEGRELDYDSLEMARTRPTSSTPTRTRRPASSSSSTRSSARRSTSAPPTSTSSRCTTTCGSATASTAA